MSIKIINCDIENCGTGVCVKGNANVDITKTIFKNNFKDIDLNVTRESNITIEDIKSVDCKTDSITINEYEANITNVIEKINNLDIDEKFKMDILDKLNQMRNNKDNALLLNKLMCEIYTISKGVGITVLAQGICKMLGWI